MNVLLILNGHNIGGAELQFLELAQHISRNHSVSVISVHGDQAAKHFGLRPEISIFSFLYQSKAASISQILKAVNCGRRLKPDVIISTSFIGNAIAFPISKFTRSRLLSLQTVSKAMTYPKLDRALLRQFNVLVAGCSDIRDYLLSHGQSEDRIEIVNNWVDFSSRVVSQPASAIRKRLGIPEEATIIGCIGRMHHQKGQEFLIRAFRTLAEDRPDLKLLLVGDGPRMDDMRAEANGHPDIIFTGTAEGNDYNDFLNAIDIYVQPSRFEGLPRTLLDAMYMRRPVIATAVNGHLDAIKNGENGLLVPAERADLLVTALTTLLDEPNRAEAFAHRAHQDAVRGFSAVTQMSAIEGLML